VIDLHIGSRSWPAVAAASATWTAAATGRWWGAWGLAILAPVAVSAVVWRRHRRLMLMILVITGAGWWSGVASSERDAEILAHESPPGPIATRMRLLGDPRSGQRGWWVLAVADPPEPGRPPAIPMLLSASDEPPAGAGEYLLVEGDRSPRTGTARGDPYSGVVRVDEASRVEVSLPPWWAAGNGVRRRALEKLEGRGPTRALLAGFLVGHTRELPEADLEAMRRTGLTHLVAVSGSNVALFLMLTLLAAGPLAAGPRRRALVGIAALVVLVVATRWEPSVVRASVMAALVLGGRVGGWALDTATALAVTVIGVVVVFGDMSTDVGFTLSVLATLGVMVGGNLRVESLPRPVATTLGATIGAQIAVSPVLLTVFGSMPLMAPLTNLVAVPVVAATTVVGAVGVAIGWEPLISLATAGSAIVLAVARLGAGWPQIGWFGLVAAAATLALGTRRSLRPVVSIAGAGAIAVFLLAGQSTLPRPGAVVLDVGQGDAILVASGDGRNALFDGGPDPARLEEKLSAYGVTSLDLVVLTHVHADHAAGLLAVLGRRAVGELWLPSGPHSTPAAREVLQLVESNGVRAGPAPVGQTVSWGEFQIEVLGPVRRYASPNDQSIVVRVGVPGGPKLLLTGDVETHAQADLAGVMADILKVPHQGAATSDLDWLAEVGARWAIISVGPNDFGHPAREVVAALEATGATVSRTDRSGDVEVDLSVGATPPR